MKPINFKWILATALIFAGCILVLSSTAFTRIDTIEQTDLLIKKYAKKLFGQVVSYENSSSRNPVIDSIEYLYDSTFLFTYQDYLVYNFIAKYHYPGADTFYETHPYFVVKNNEDKGYYLHSSIDSMRQLFVKDSILKFHGLFVDSFNMKKFDTEWKLASSETNNDCCIVDKYIPKQAKKENMPDTIELKYDKTYNPSALTISKELDEFKKMKCVSSNFIYHSFGQLPPGTLPRKVFGSELKKSKAILPESLKSFIKHLSAPSKLPN